MHFYFTTSVAGRGRFLADAAHIFPLGRGGPDCIENTALMYPATHLLYDHGLIALSDDHRILTKDSLSDNYRRALNHDGRRNASARHASVA